MQQSLLPSSFVPDDPNAHLAGPDLCLYLTTTAIKYGSIVFDGHLWNREGSTSVNNGFISQRRIIFSTSATSSGREAKYQGNFSSDDGKYACVSVCKTDLGFNLSRFSLKNQKLNLDPQSVAVEEQVSEPISAFFLYKQDTFRSVQNLNPNLKYSQINALISQNWENLAESMRACYHLIYEERVERYKENWVVPYGNKRLRKRVMDLKQSDRDDEIMPQVKMWRPNRPNLVLTQISSIVSHKFYFCLRDQDQEYHYLSREIDSCNKNIWEKNDCWIRAINQVKEKYQEHMKCYEKERQYYYNKEDYSDSDVDSKQSHPGLRHAPHYLDKGHTFEAVMIDLTNRDVFEICVSKLSGEFQNKRRDAPQTKKYLIAHILREKDFNPQTIKGVLDFVHQQVEEIGDESE